MEKYQNFSSISSESSLEHAPNLMSSVMSNGCCFLPSGLFRCRKIPRELQCATEALGWCLILTDQSLSWTQMSRPPGFQLVAYQTNVKCYHLPNVIRCHEWWHGWWQMSSYLICCWLKHKPSFYVLRNVIFLIYDASLLYSGIFIKGHNKSQSSFSGLSLILLSGSFNPDTNTPPLPWFSCHFPSLFFPVPKPSILGYYLNNSSHLMKIWSI